MKRMSIYEPAMCCDTGVCGVNVDPELVRISTVINNLKKNGITIERYNLSSEPMAFVNNKKVKDALDKNGTTAVSNQPYGDAQAEWKRTVRTARQERLKKKN